MPGPLAPGALGFSRIAEQHHAPDAQPSPGVTFQTWERGAT